jgi:hypothetical protein
VVHAAAAAVDTAVDATAGSAQPDQDQQPLPSEGFFVRFFRVDLGVGWRILLWGGPQVHAAQFLIFLDPASETLDSESRAAQFPSCCLKQGGEVPNTEARVTN